ncbi:Methyltransferase FkbM domain-containing protein [Caenorhabditis elegans]|uniref:Methyltransferase FkbM domain-containing protein n=1 Tax=Caenorhabditis elegans TaxID=6239 RepID=O16872_CAEEL|nr:Methyltransferase FkbM domain-containing protein [Caenorhabditis elegans]CCD63102.2 Methyltransferase FkbM domain-containing protein [Caenorhabditis elegans]|eukprot:NP_504848.2 Uncharacterized protein CELE_C13A2.10 [Caenorhabditis elegans]
MIRLPYNGPTTKEKSIKAISLRKLFFTLLLFCSITIIYMYIRPAYSAVYKPPTPTENKKSHEKEENSDIFQAFHDCFLPKLETITESYRKFWYEFANVTKDCDNLKEYNSLDIQAAKNKDEVKYVVFPKNNNEPLTMVTLGIGRDIRAELRLKAMYPNIAFYGADPGVAVNKDLYESTLGGKFYNYAVSGQNGIHISKIFLERNFKVDATEHIRADYFFRKILNKNRIDILWIDIEQNEYGILEQIHQNGKLDQVGVKICQMNVEFHKDVFGNSDAEMQKFYDFVFKVLEDKKYILLKPKHATYMDIIYIRAFIVNVADSECTDLYIK